MEWRDVSGLLEEWANFPPIEEWAAAYFGHKSEGEEIQPGDKFWGDDELGPEVKRASGALPLSAAPPEVREIFAMVKAQLQKESKN